MRTVHQEEGRVLGRLHRRAVVDAGAMVPAHVPPRGLPAQRQRRLPPVPVLGHRAGPLFVRSGIPHDPRAPRRRRRRGRERHRGERGGAVHRPGHMRDARRARLHPRQGPAAGRGGQAVAPLRRPGEQRGNGDGASGAAGGRRQVLPRAGVRGKHRAVAVRVRRGRDARGADAALRARTERRGHRREGGVAGDGGDVDRHGARSRGDDFNRRETALAVGGVPGAHRASHVLQRTRGAKPCDWFAEPRARAAVAGEVRTERYQSSRRAADAGGLRERGGAPPAHVPDRHELDAVALVQVPRGDGARWRDPPRRAAALGTARGRFRSHSFRGGRSRLRPLQQHPKVRGLRPDGKEILA